jgi:hypothetical protein
MSTRKPELLRELKDVRQRLEEAEDTIRAIREGNVDAIVASGPGGDQIFVLKGADESYRRFIESMREGAVTLVPDGTIAYSNRHFSEMLKTPLERVMGAPLARFVVPEQRTSMERLIAQALAGDVRCEVRFQTGDGNTIWTELLLSPTRLNDAIGIAMVATDVTERKKADELRAYLAALVNSSDYAIFGRDLTGNILTWNPGAEQVFGYSAREIIGQSSSILHLPRRLDSYFDALEYFAGLDPANRANATRRSEGEWVRKDRRRIHVTVSVSALWDADGNLEGTSTIIRDITDRRLAEQEVLRLNENLERRVAERTEQLERAAGELAKRNQEVERVNRMKSEFLARVSHELRTPLNAIVGYAELLTEQSAGPLTPPYPRYVANIHEGSRHLLEIVNDLLDITRIEAGRIVLSRETLSPVDVWKEVLSVILPLADAKNISIESHIPPEMRIHADRTRFKQVLYNLLSNAVKFTPENGQVWIAEASQDNRAGFCVGDTGIGIPASELESIFDEFHQVAGASTGENQGTGLGLSITRHLVRLHGGEIHVKSAPGEGSRFIFTLGPESLAAAESERTEV